MNAVRPLIPERSEETAQDRVDVIRDYQHDVDNVDFVPDVQIVEDVDELIVRRMVCSPVSGSARMRVTRHFTGIGVISMLAHQEIQKARIVKILKNEMCKAGTSYENTDAGDWIDCSRLGGWTKIHLRIAGCRICDVLHTSFLRICLVGNMA